MDTFIAVDIGGTRLRASVYPPEGVVPLTQKRIPTRGPGSPVERLLGLIAEVWPGEARVGGIGVAAPGPVDPEKGVIYSAPNIPGWENLFLRSVVEDRFQTPVKLGNDANMATLGEWRYGAGKGHHNMMYFTISTGIGGGVVAEDKLLLGAQGLATEVGHVTIDPDGPRCGCGHFGHLEAFSSGTAIANYVAAELAKGALSSLQPGPRPTTVEIATAAAQGDKLALAAFERAGYYLGMGLANYLHIFNPSIVVFGGGVSRSGGLLFDPMMASVKEHVLSPAYIDKLTIAPAALGDDGGLLGALALARAG